MSNSILSQANNVITISKNKNPRLKDDNATKSTTMNQDLHRALIYNSPYKVKVMKQILKKDPQAINYIDTDRNTPLHIVLLNYKEKTSEIGSEDSFHKYNGYVTEVLKLFYNKKPSLLTTKNNNGLIPFEVAAGECASIDILMTLWRATKDVWMKEEIDLNELYFTKKYYTIGRRDTMGSCVYIYDNILPICW